MVTKKSPSQKRRIWPTVVALVAVIVIGAGATAGCAMLATLPRGGDQPIATTEVIAEIRSEIVPDIIASTEPVYIDKMAGLEEAIAGRFGSARYAVMLYGMSDPRVSLEINADTSFTAASTYKLFVAYMMLRGAETGSTLPSCFDQMIVYSDNDCPQAYLSQISYARANAMVRELGLYDTTLAYEMKTTARDLADFLTMIYGGTILSPDSNARLIDAMLNQVYRDGIPAGVGGRGAVADKVGFLNGNLHDAAIVYSATGDYILVILSDGSTWRAIADVAAMIDARI